MTQRHITTAATATGGFLAVAWGAFVAAFLYYVVLTLVAIGVEQLPDTAMIVAYLLPVAIYTAVLGARAIRAVASVSVDIGHLAHPRLQ